jgi:hypothetical protein
MNKSIKISLRIIALFSVAILVSKIPQLYPNFFGDWLCEGRKVIWEDSDHIKYHTEGCDIFQAHNSTWHWGYQHYLFFLMGLSLAIIQIIDIVNIAKKD